MSWVRTPTFAEDKGSQQVLQEVRVFERDLRNLVSTSYQDCLWDAKRAPLEPPTGTAMQS